MSIFFTPSNDASCSGKSQSDSFRDRIRCREDGSQILKGQVGEPKCLIPGNFFTSTSRTAGGKESLSF